MGWREGCNSGRAIPSQTRKGSARHLRDIFGWHHPHWIFESRSKSHQQMCQSGMCTTHPIEVVMRPVGDLRKLKVVSEGG